MSELPDIPLEQFFPHVDDKPPKIYSNFRSTVTQSDSPHVLLVNLGWLNEALTGDCVWATTPSERRSETFKLPRYERAVLEINGNKPLYMPWLFFKRGRTRIMDGRHRLYAMIDLEYTHAPVVVDTPYLQFIQTLVEDGVKHSQ